MATGGDLENQPAVPGGRHVVNSRDYYDALAPAYDAELSGRAAYTAGINRLVVEWIQRRQAATVLDVGCGNGSRLATILAASGATGVGIDESRAMVEGARERGLDAFVRDIAAGPPELPAPRPAGFDMVIALWNVLGHIHGRDARHQALRNMRSALSEGGLVIVDVNNRHNARQYGWRRAGRNLVRDWLGRATGDFVVARSVAGHEIATVSHIFSKRELLQLVGDSGLRPLALYYVDYATGEVRPRRWSGQFCLVAEAAD